MELERNWGVLLGIFSVLVITPLFFLSNGSDTPASLSHLNVTKLLQDRRPSRGFDTFVALLVLSKYLYTRAVQKVLLLQTQLYLCSLKKT